ncbi:MAG: D-glycero-beta-D-manno-heptose 1-phosphate adenylyltransferase, partial [Chitinophagaceae bacterium]
FSLEALIKQVQIWKFQGQKIVFTNGCFDILHYGHIQLITQAASLGNKLIIGLNADVSVKKLKGPNRPIFQESTRAKMLASLLLVDGVVLFKEETPEILIQTLLPDVLVKGGDYSLTSIVGANSVLENGGRVEIIPLIPGLSTTNIEKRIIEW